MKSTKTEKKLREAVRIVTEILIETPITRDDDRLLVWMYWRKQFPGLDRCTVRVFRNTFLGGMLSTPDTITRARRKVQEAREDLRGITYNSHKDLQEVYKEYFGGCEDVQDDLFSGRFKDVAITRRMYDKIVEP